MVVPSPTPQQKTQGWWPVGACMLTSGVMDMTPSACQHHGAHQQGMTYWMRSDLRVCFWDAQGLVLGIFSHVPAL